MLDRRRSKILVLLFVSCATIDASKCPEARKPHVTSCTIFYNCINLPEGGYVWVPAKCWEGLVFQPYLRICVLPGDTWTCDDLSTENPQLSNNHRYQEVSASTTGSPSIDSSYAIEDDPGLGNVRPLATPYPLIEIIGHGEKMNSPTTMPEKNEQGMESYLHEFFKSQARLRTRLDSASSTNNGKNARYTWLRGIIDRILLYENYEDFGSAPCRSDIPKNGRFDGPSKHTLKYLVESYVLGTRNPSGQKSKKNHRKSTMTEENRAPASGTAQIDDSTNPLKHETKLENNVVVIEGNLGEREFVTVEKYKLLSAQMNLRVIEVLPCARSVRLPNSTDCSKYYTCDPETADIAEFSCPPRTAFNNYTRVCDLQLYKICSRRRDERPEETTANFVTAENGDSSDATEISQDDGACRNTGKFVDRASDKHYWVCYSSQANPSKIESLRMTCPNNLIFCQERRVCSTRKRCYDG